MRLNLDMLRIHYVCMRFSDFPRIGLLKRTYLFAIFTCIGIHCLVLISIERISSLCAPQFANISHTGNTHTHTITHAHIPHKHLKGISIELLSYRYIWLIYFANFDEIGKFTSFRCGLLLFVFVCLLFLLQSRNRSLNRAINYNQIPWNTYTTCTHTDTIGTFNVPQKLSFEFY